jgi:hypothetical protein
VILVLLKYWTIYVFSIHCFGIAMSIILPLSLEFGEIVVVLAI